MQLINKLLFILHLFTFILLNESAFTGNFLMSNKVQSSDRIIPSEVFKRAK